MNETEATGVLRRFDTAVTRVARQMAETFGPTVELEDAEQDARIQVLVYAGLAPSQHGLGHSGKLKDIEANANGDEPRIQNIVSAQLRLDLSRYYGREAEKRVPQVSLAEVTEDSAVCDFTERMTGDISSSRFPFLHAHYSRGMTVQEISDAAGLSRRTVDRRIAGEKHRFAAEYCKRAGLVVEGDETTEELTEAYGYLKAAGR